MHATEKKVGARFDLCTVYGHNANKRVCSAIIDAELYQGMVGKRDYKAFKKLQYMEWTIRLYRGSVCNLCYSSQLEYEG